MVSKATIQALRAGSFETKLRAGGYYNNVRITLENGRMVFHFRYNQDLLTEIKESFEGRKYHGFLENDGRKVWSAPITQRNLFQLEALQGKYAPIDPYTQWSNLTFDLTRVQEYCKNRPTPIQPWRHQLEMVNLGIQVRHFILAAEMRTGKTLAAMLICEMSNFYEYGNFIWVGPRSALVGARAEFHRWETRLAPEFMTYRGLVKLIENWPTGRPAPRLLILDESSLCKTPTTQTAQAAQHIADSMREEWGMECIIGELTGSPAPKNPSDWWKQAEIACPGFLREANIFTFRQRLGHYRQEGDEATGQYQKLYTWKDDSSKCKWCGEIKDHPNHQQLDFEAMLMNGSISAEQTFERHEFEAGVNEVEQLGRRLQGLAGAWKEEDCLDLPKRRYEIVDLEPSQELLNIASNVVNTTTRAVDALIKLRTLSDGFVYEEKGTGEYGPCNGCKSTGLVKQYFDPDEPSYLPDDEEREQGVRYIVSECPPGEDPIDYVPEVVGERKVSYVSREVACSTCGGSGKVEKTERKIIEIECPKVELLKELLDQHAEWGRFVVCAGFEGSIHRVVRTCIEKQWWVVKVDGKGWKAWDSDGTSLPWSDDEMYHNFREERGKYERMCFVLQPGAGGMGLNLAISPTLFYYSNDYNPQSRIQSEARCRGNDMDRTRGGLIIDCVHLPTDLKVLTTLKERKRVQNISLEALKALYR